jgi:plastocyanin
MFRAALDDTLNAVPGRPVCVIYAGLLAIVLAAALTVPAQAANQTVGVVDNEFNPVQVAVKPGESVTWNASGVQPHNVAFDDGGFIDPLPARPGPWTTTRTFASAGTYRYYCQVHGGPGGQGMSGTVFVNATGNVPPLASLSVSPNPAQTGATVTFDGSGSRDPDGTISRYDWDLDGDGSFETNTGTTATASRSYTTAGTVSVKLRVTDSGGETAGATSSLIVTSPAVVAPALQGTSPTTAGSTGTGDSTNTLAPPPPSFAASKKSIVVTRSGRFSYSFVAKPGLRGTLALRSATKVRVSVRRKISLGTKHFIVPSSGTVTVSWRLSRKNLRILKRNAKIRFRATVTLQSPAGLARSAASTLTLKRPAR